MNDEYARAVLQAGRDLGIKPRGIAIGFATVYVESDWIMYANAKVPDSLNIPHERVGSDAFSVGLFQQQVVWGNGAWWWGDAATCMDPYQSARLFFLRLSRLDYTSNAHTPGWYAQQIQQSAYPDRYDQRIADAQSLYDRLSGGNVTTPVAPNRPDFNEIPLFLSGNAHERDVNDIDLWLLHTQEPPEGSDNRNDAALELRNFLESTVDDPDNPVSYHYTGSMAGDGGTTVIDCVDTDMASWSVGNSNNRSINFCFAGSRSDWTRQEWLDNERGSIRAAAYLFVQDCAKYPKLQARVIADPYSNPPGAADHNYCTKYLRDGNNHTDVGPNFPWDVFKSDVAEFAGQQPPAPPPDDQPPAPPPPPAPVDELWDQLCGRWEMLGWQTVVETLAQLRDKFTGTADAGKRGFRAK